jgi:hypothetical protein
MTAREFVTCIALMAGAAKLPRKKPKRPRYLVAERIDELVEKLLP